MANTVRTLELGGDLSTADQLQEDRVGDGRNGLLLVLEGFMNRGVTLRTTDWCWADQTEDGQDGLLMAL